MNHNSPTRRRMLFATSAVMLSLVAAACGSSTTTAPATTAARTTVAPTTAADAATTTAAASTQTIVDIAAGNPDFSILVEAIKAAGLVETLSGKGPFTVFAPTNEAFANALTALNTTKEKLFADTKTLTAILTYHVVVGSVMAADVVKLDGQSVATVNGAKVKISVSGSTVKVNDATVVKTDIEASNGIIHVIDSVLVPPAG